jgi:signal transduction histidine kinase
MMMSIWIKFEPMFTAKKTGTGLVICKSIIEQQGAVSQ